MEKIKEQAKQAFHKINDREYRCALAEAQVSEELYEQVKKEYGIAENAFVQGAIHRFNMDSMNAVAWLSGYLTSKKVSCEEWTEAINSLRKAMKE